MNKYTYEDLIAEAFIKPIRSVLIVDDDYPTLHEILLDEVERNEKHGHKDWNKSSESRKTVRRVIDEFRRPDAPYMLDIHDGSSPEEAKDEEQVHTLQQTDLLVLDYQLDKSKENDGAAAVRIAREALSNKHFNLILVHTQEPLERIFYEFLIGFMVKHFTKGDERTPDQRLQAFLNEYESELLVAIADPQYAAARRLEDHGPAELQRAIQIGLAPWGDAKALFERAKLHRSEWQAAVRYALEVFEVAKSDRFATEAIGLVDWRVTDTMFIRASRGFVAFKSKLDGKELLPAMRKALVSWDPRPSRLMLTKLRAVMNERGIEVQDDALGRADVGAIWYWRLLAADEQNLNSIVDRTVRHHSEQLLDLLLPEVSVFAKNIRAIDAERDPFEVVKQRFKLDFTDEKILENAKLGHNAFVGSKPLKSAHLDIGHILKLEEHYWICLTPSCDMVPKVHRGNPHDRIEGVKRFTALRLHEPSPAVNPLLSANRGGQVFANVWTGPGKTERRAFSASFTPESSPVWMTMYVQNDGFLPDVEGPTCNVIYVAKPGPGDEPGIPVIRHKLVTVCGLLRYEYALEIQSRFITSQARIGLDFESSDDRNDGAAE